MDMPKRQQEVVLKAESLQSAIAAPSWLTLVLIAFAIVWFSTLGARRLLDPDEGRYAEIAREMLVTGDWITPRLNGIKYFEKPPLQYWMTAGAYAVLGQNEFAARLWSGLCGFAGVLLAWYAGARLYGAMAGRMAAFVLASSLLYVVIGQLNDLDMGLCFFLEAALCSFLLSRCSLPASMAERRWMLTAWIAAALAFLSKGLIALILPALSLMAYSLVARDYSAWKRLYLWPGLALFLAIGAPWVVAVSAANPEFPAFFFVHEHFARFLSQVHDRDGPWWYFLPLLLIGALPWTSIALQGLRRSWRADRLHEFQSRRFLILWIVTVVGFFSLSHSKLPPYIVPVMPALALVLGDMLGNLRAPTLRRHFTAIAALLIVVAAIVALAPADIAGARSIQVVNDLRGTTALGLALAACGLAVASWTLQRHSISISVSVASAGMFLGLSLVLIGSDALRGTRSGYDLALQIAPHVSERTKLYSVGAYDQTLPFYLRRTLTLVGYRGELEFGLKQEPELALSDLHAFTADWAAQSAASAVMPPKVYAELVEDKVPMKLIARSAKLVAVVKP